MSKLLGQLTFKLAGWQYHVEPNILEKKQVIVGFEHTSMMDAILALALFQIYGIKIHTLIKKELFKGPMAPLLKKLELNETELKALEAFMESITSVIYREPAPKELPK